MINSFELHRIDEPDSHLRPRHQKVAIRSFAFLEKGIFELSGDGYFDIPTAKSIEDDFPPDVTMDADTKGRPMIPPHSNAKPV